MGYLLLAISCSLAIAVLMKLAEGIDVDRVGMLTVNYLVGAILAAVLTGNAPPAAAGWPTGLLVFGAATGGVFIAGFFVFGLATRRAGMSLSVGVMRVSVVLPVLVSWAVWAERPTWGQGAGLVLAGAAFFALAGRAPPWQRQVRVRVERPAGSAFAVLLLLLLVAGLSDICLKTYEEVFGAAHGPSRFTLLVFGTAFGIGAIVTLTRVVRGRPVPARGVWTWGIPLGLANVGSVEFMLRALERLPAPYVFPVNNIVVVLGAALLGTTIWRERLSRMNLIGLGLAALALGLMNV